MTTRTVGRLRLQDTSRYVGHEDNGASRADPAGETRKLPPNPADPRKPTGTESPAQGGNPRLSPLSPGSAKTGLSRRRSRVRVPSLPSQEVLQNAILRCLQTRQPETSTGRLPSRVRARKAIGERFGDRDLFAMALHAEGHMLVRAGHVREGLALLDESMVVVTTQGSFVRSSSASSTAVSSSPVQDAFEVARARQWTRALTEWKEQQPWWRSPGAASYTAPRSCSLGGSWAEALEEARLAGGDASSRDQQPRRRRGALPAGGASAAPGRVRGCGGGVFARRAGSAGNLSRAWRELRLAQGKGRGGRSPRSGGATAESDRAAQACRAAPRPGRDRGSPRRE